MSFTSIHFIFHLISSLFVSRSLSSLQSHAELLLWGHDCRLASSLISLFIPLSHSWLTNTKRRRMRFPVLSAVSWKKVARGNRRTANQFNISSLLHFAASPLVSAKRLKAPLGPLKRSVSFWKHVTPFVWFPCLRCSPLHSVCRFKYTIYTNGDCTVKAEKVTSLHGGQNTIIIGLHVGEHDVCVCIFNMLCVL